MMLEEDDITDIDLVVLPHPKLMSKVKIWTKINIHYQCDARRRCWAGGSHYTDAAMLNQQSLPTRHTLRENKSKPTKKSRISARYKSSEQQHAERSDCSLLIRRIQHQNQQGSPEYLQSLPSSRLISCPILIHQWKSQWIQRPCRPRSYDYLL